MICVILLSDQALCFFWSHEEETKQKTGRSIHFKTRKKRKIFTSFLYLAFVLTFETIPHDREFIPVMKS